MPDRPSFSLRIEAAPGRHILERMPRYRVMLNDAPQGELYFNMTGYVGYLPTVQGGKMDIGERGIGAFRREVAALNREAREAIGAALDGARRLVLTRPTEDPRLVFALSRDEDGGPDGIHLLSRRELIAAERLFGSRDVGIGFFSEHGFDPGDAPTVLFEEIDRALAAGLPHVRSRIMDAAEAETHERGIDRIIGTTDPLTCLVVTRRVQDDFDPEPAHVTRASLDLGRARFGDSLRLSDLEVLPDPPVIADAGDLAWVRREFPWLDAGPAPMTPTDAPGPTP